MDRTNAGLLVVALSAVLFGNGCASQVVSHDFAKPAKEWATEDRLQVSWYSSADGPGGQVYATAAEPGRFEHRRHDGTSFQTDALLQRASAALGLTGLAPVAACTRGGNADGPAAVVVARDPEGALFALVDRGVWSRHRVNDLEVAIPSLGKEAAVFFSLAPLRLAAFGVDVATAPLQGVYYVFRTTPGDERMMRGAAFGALIFR